MCAACGAWRHRAVNVSINALSGIVLLEIVSIGLDLALFVDFLMNFHRKRGQFQTFTRISSIFWEKIVPWVENDGHKSISSCGDTIPLLFSPRSYNTVDLICPEQWRLYRMPVYDTIKMGSNNHGNKPIAYTGIFRVFVFFFPVVHV